MEGRTVPAIEIDFETPDQSVDEVERKITASTPMPHAEEQEKKTIQFSPSDTVEDTTSNMPETIKEGSPTKRTSFTERVAMMVGMKPKDKEEVVPTNENGKLFGTVSAITTEANQNNEQIEQGETADQGATAHHEKTTSLELGNLIAKIDQNDKKLTCSEENRQVLKKKLRYNKNKTLDIYFNLARATEEKLQQMSDKVKATDKEREKKIKKDMQEMKHWYDTVNNKLWSLERRIDIMSKDQAESSCAIQSKLVALLRNSTAQEKLVTERTQSN